MKTPQTPQTPQTPRTIVVALVGAAITAACVHIVDPREAANTDVGLQVWAQVTPATLSIRDTVTRLRIRVNVKNPGRDTLRIDNGGLPCSATTDPVDGRGLQHSMRIGDDTDPLDAGPRGDVCGTLLLVFPPRRTRSVDFYVTIKGWRAGGWPVVTEEYRVRSYFAGYEGYSAVFTLIP